GALVPSIFPKRSARKGFKGFRNPIAKLNFARCSNCAAEGCLVISFGAVFNTGIPRHVVPTTPPTFPMKCPKMPLFILAITLLFEGFIGLKQPENIIFAQKPQNPIVKGNIQLLFYSSSRNLREMCDNPS